MSRPSPGSKREDSVHRRLDAFLATEGLRADLGDPRVQEAFVAIGLSGCTPSTRGTYRSVLREGRGKVAPALSYAGSRAPVPYTMAERAELFSLVRAQRREWRRTSGLALLVLSIGAGLRTREIVVAKGSDVIARSHRSPTVRLVVRGARPRMITVFPPYAELLLGLALFVDNDFLFHQEPADRSYPNFISDFTSHLVCDPSAPRCSVARGRSSFICDHLERPTPLKVLLEIAGIVEVESLLRYTHHVPISPKSKAALRRLLMQETNSR